MKKLILIACALVASITLFAQDIIVTKEAKKIEAKILEVSKTEIKYKELDNLDGPTFILGTEDINSIIYSNGKVALFNDNPSVENKEPEVTARDEAEQPVIVDFEIKGTSNPLWYEFKNLSSEAPGIRWDFGDGTFSFAKDVASHVYEKKGTYTITLTATIGDKKYKQQKTLIVGESAQQVQQEQTDRAQQALVESGAQLGQAIRELVAIKNSYALDVVNNTKHPYRINLDGHILGVVNPYKTERFIVPVETYGRMQAVQTSGYVFSPSIKEFRIPRQQKQTACKVVIK